MNLFYAIQRIIAQQLRRPRSRGYGVQSPWVYRFVREVAMAKEGNHSEEPFQKRLQHWCEFVAVYDVATDPQTIDWQMARMKPPNALVLKGIHRNRRNYRYWLEILEDERVGLAFDCFDFGVLFFDLKMHKHVYKINYKA